MKPIILFLILLPLSLNKEVSKWHLKIKNALEEAKPIVLLPGIFTKVTFELSNEKDEFDPDSDELNFFFSLDDENLVTYNSQYSLTASGSIKFTSYIGLKCGHSITETNYKLKFKVDSIKDSDGKDATASASLVFDDNVQVEISNQKTQIDLEPVMKGMPGESVNYLKVKKDPYNVYPIDLVPGSISSDVEIPNGEIRLEAFGELRGEFSIENALNNGILWASKFGIKKAYESLVNKSIGFNLSIKGDLEKCFELKTKTFNIQVVKDKIADIKNKAKQIKEAIKYNLENISPIHASVNGLNFRVNVPVAPIVLSCEFRADTQFSTDDDIINQVNAEAHYYKNVITSSGQISLNIAGLSSDTEYFSKCVISDTDFVNGIKNVAFTIGNFLEADVVSKLIPSRDVNRTPQCAKFEFKGIADKTKFDLLATRYCKYIMTKGEPLLAKVLGTVVCKILKTSIISDIVTKSSTICVAPSPLYNVNKLLTKKTTEDFNKRFDTFIENISTGPKILKILKLDDIEIIKITRFYDSQSIDTSLISLTKTKESSSFILNSFSINFEIKSTNPQPIQCYYNKDLGTFSSKFTNLLVENGFGASVILEPGETKSISFTTSISKMKEGETYSLYLNCYNLPDFEYRFESTGMFPVYSYIYSKDSKINQDVPKPIKITINCEEKIHKMNPHCIKTQIISITNQLKTKIPEFISAIEDKVEQFSKMAEQAQMQVLTSLNSTLKAAISEAKNVQSNVKTLFEKAIETAKYLANKDCSIYASGSTSDDGETIKAGLYIECRNKKKYIVNQLLSVLKDHLTCTKIVDLIETGLSNDVEENLKYVLLLINEISKNPESLERGASQVLYDTASCLQNKFSDYWTRTKNYLQTKTDYLDQSILAVKRDASNIIMQTLSNLVNVLHFDEIDGYLREANAKVENTGLMVYDKAVKIHKDIFKFLKNMNEFGEGNYKISDTMTVNVTLNADFNENEDDVEFVSEIKDKGITLLLHSNYMLRKMKAYAMQSVVFDSPLVSVEAGANIDESTVNTFIGITLYDKDGNEIVVSDLNVEAFRPQILYSKEIYGNLQSCLYFDEKKETLNNNGIEIIKDFIYNGKEYVKCVSKHLTSFTASTASYSSSSSWWVVVLIILASILVLCALALLFIYLRRATSKKVRDSDIMKNNVDSKV